MFSSPGFLLILRFGYFNFGYWHRNRDRDRHPYLRRRLALFDGRPRRRLRLSRGHGALWCGPNRDEADGLDAEYYRRAHRNRAFLPRRLFLLADLLAFGSG